MTEQHFLFVTHSLKIVFGLVLYDPLNNGLSKRSFWIVHVSIGSRLPIILFFGFLCALCCSYCLILLQQKILLEYKMFEICSKSKNLSTRLQRIIELDEDKI